MNEKPLRTKYIRLLEKFANSTAAWLSKTNTPSKETLEKKLKILQKPLEKISQKPRLYKENLLRLEGFSTSIIEMLNDKNTNINQIKQWALKEINLIQKSKNKSQYNRQKQKQDLDLD